MGKKKQRSKKELDELFNDDEDPPASNAAAAADSRGKKKSGKGDPADDMPAVDEDHEDEPSFGNAETRKKKKKGKKGKMQESFFKESESDDEGIDREQVEIETSKKSKASTGFGALVASDEEENDSSGVDDEKPQNKGLAMQGIGETTDEESVSNGEDTSTGKANGVPKGAKGLSFAALGLGDDVEDEEKLENLPTAKPKPKKKKKAKGFESAFAALDIDDDDDDEAGEEASVEKSKTKQSGATLDSLSVKQDGQTNVAASQSAEVELPPARAKPKTSKKKMNLADLEDAFTSLESGPAKQTEGDATATKAPMKKKKKTKPGGLDFDALMEELDGPQSVDGSNVEKAKKAEKILPEDLLSDPSTTAADTVVQEEQGEAPEPAASVVPEPKAGKKKKKKGKAAAEKDAEDIDAILVEIDGSAPASAPVDPGHGEAVDSGQQTGEGTVTKDTTVLDGARTSDANPEAPSGDLEDDGQAEPKVLTAAQKKNLRKKAKKAKEAAQQEEQSAPKEKKVPAHIRKIQEAQEKRRLEEERLRKLEEERIRLEEEEKRREEELERQKEEEREKKRLEKEKLRKSGALLTKKAQEEARKREMMREKLLEQAAAKGIAIPGATSAQSQSGEASTGKGDDLKTRASLRRQQKQREQQRAVEEKEKAEQDRLQRQAEEEQARREAQRLEDERRKAEAEKAAEDEDAPDDWDADSSEGDEEGESEVKDEMGEKKESEEAKLKSGSESETETETESEEESSDYSVDSEEEREKRLEATKMRMEDKIQEARAAGNADHLRSPICCILGHVDTGKTKILDNIRRTNVQDNEAGGITQQIGATYIPKEAILTRTESLRQGRDYNLKVPGMLVIDTPGHESFTNLRSRGSSLCDMAILVVDLMHGLEPQTIESINLLKQRKTPFVVALNKVDRLLDWKTIEDNPIRASLQQQKKHSKVEFEDRLKMCTTQLMEQGMNVALYWKNTDPRKVVNLIPTSAITGEGIPDLLQLVVKLTTSLMSERLMFLGNILQCTVLEVKAVEGLGTTIDVVLVNGELHEGDKIIVCGMAGPIVTTIRSLLTPHPLKELRVKGSYLHHKTIQAAQGVKLCAQGLEQAVAGTAMHVGRDENEVEDFCLLAKEEMESVMSRIDRSGEGVCVQASTLGSLEALLDFLKTPEVGIPVSAINIGPVHKRDIMRANVMIEKKMKKFGVILAFDVPVTKEARDLSEEMGVKVFTADIIYHLFDQFKNYMDEVKRAEKSAARDEAVFPCILKIIPTCIFNSKDPIVLGVEVMEGQLRLGTPLCVPGKSGKPEVSLGRVDSLELNHKAVEEVQRGESVAVKIRATNAEEAARLYGRHFDHTDELVSKITRESIDALKAFFKDEMSKDDWKVVIKLKMVFQVQ